jgi:hypothetical protein
VNCAVSHEQIDRLQSLGRLGRNNAPVANEGIHEGEDCFFRLTPPSVYQMLLTLEREGLISRCPGVPRSIAVLIDHALLPALEPAPAQPVKRFEPCTSDQRVHCPRESGFLRLPAGA